MVIVEQTAKPFRDFDLPCSLWHRPADNLIADPLMTALVMVVVSENSDDAIMPVPAGDSIRG